MQERLWFWEIRNRESITLLFMEMIYLSSNIFSFFLNLFISNFHQLILENYILFSTTYTFSFLLFSICCLSLSSLKNIFTKIAQYQYFVYIHSIAGVLLKWIGNSRQTSDILYRVGVHFIFRNFITHVFTTKEAKKGNINITHNTSKTFQVTLIIVLEVSSILKYEMKYTLFLFY